jgi:hypothetical protein
MVMECWNQSGVGILEVEVDMSNDESEWMERIEFVFQYDLQDGVRREVKNPATWSLVNSETTRDRKKIANGRSAMLLLYLFRSTISWATLYRCQ